MTRKAWRDGEVTVRAEDVHAALDLIDAEYGFMPDHNPTRDNPQLVRLGTMSGWTPQQINPPKE